MCTAGCFSHTSSPLQSLSQLEDHLLSLPLHMIKLADKTLMFFSFYKIFTKPLKKRAEKSFEVILMSKYDAHRIEIFLQLCFYHVYPPALPGPTLHPPLQQLVRQDRTDFSIFRKKRFIFCFKLMGQDFTLACIFRVAL